MVDRSLYTPNFGVYVGEKDCVKNLFQKKLRKKTFGLFLLLLWPDVSNYSNNDEKDSTDMEAEPTPSNSIETVAETSVDAASSSQDSKPEDNEPTQVCLILH